jgi:hypothetical protein
MSELWPVLFIFINGYSSNLELHNLYSLPNIINMIKYKRMGWAGHLTHIGENRNACRVMAGKRIQGTSIHGLEDSTKIDLRETGCQMD